MKTLFTILMMLSGIFAYSQAIIGMSPVIISNPADAQTPSSTASYNTNIVLTASVKNYGTSPFTGTVNVFAQRDTTNGVFCDSTTIFPNLNPNDSVIITLSFFPLPGPNGFKTAGNGNTIVVWPIIVSGSGLNGDSARTIIWLDPSTGIEKIDPSDFNIYPNPFNESISIKTTHNEAPEEIRIYNLQGILIQLVSNEMNIQTSSLSSGIYFIHVKIGDKKYIQKLIKK